MKLSEFLNISFGRIAGVTACTAALTACCALSAQPTDGKNAPPKPPPEALASCQALSSGMACNFTSPHGVVKGTCWAPEGKPLACKPKDAPSEGRPSAKQ